MTPNPRTVSQELFTREKFQPVTILERDGRGVDPVPDPRLVPAPAGHDGQRPRDSAGRRRRVARAADAAAQDAGRSAKAAGSQAAAGLRQRQLPLVGRLAGLRQHARGAGDAADRDQGQGQGRRRLPAGSRPGHGARSHRHDGERLGGAQPAARPLRPGTQRGLRPAGAGVSRVGRSAALRQGTAGRQRPDGQDPHRGVDAGDHAASAHRAGAAHELVRPGAGTPESVPQPPGQRVSRAASPVRRPTTTPRRIR